MNNTVYLKQCSTYDAGQVLQAVTQIIDHFGGVDKVLQRGKNILIKPNLLMARPPEGATTAHPEVVYAVAKLFCDAGAKVTIADSPGGPYTGAVMRKVYAQCGMESAAQRSGAQLNFDVSSKRTSYQGIQNRTFELIMPITQADTIINIAKAKTHMLTYYTGAVKNLFGTIAGLNKAMCHAKMPDAMDFCGYLVDLCQYHKPTINIIDGVEGMDGKGPSGGRVRHVGVIAAGENPFACDLTMMHIVGLNPNLSPVHKIAVEHKLVAAQPEQLTLLGDDFPPIAQPFTPAVQHTVVQGTLGLFPKFIRRLFVPHLGKYPKITGRCVGCGDCVRACPKQALALENRRAKLDKKKCIKCYCCHELCPVKAIDL